MRVLLVSQGSIGDIMPILALAQALSQHGHHTQVALPRHLVARIAHYAIKVVPIGPDLSDVFHDSQLRISEGTFTAQDAEQGQRAMVGGAQQAIQELVAMARNADLIVCLYGMPFVDLVHRMTGRPVVVVRSIYPGHESPLPRQSGVPLHSVGSFQPALTLYAISRCVLEPDPTWPANHRQTGFFFWEDAPWTPPDELCAFMEDGPPPVVITLGSMIHSDPTRVTAVLAEAIAQVGCRAIFQSGWSGLAQHGGLPPHSYAADFLPHSWLFPRAGGVIHHGGVGTTAAALRHGVGMVMVPHAVDQFIISERVAALGCVGGVVPYQSLNANALASAIARMLDNPQIRQSAQAASAIVQSEGGVELACELIAALPLAQRTN